MCSCWLFIAYQLVTDYTIWEIFRLIMKYIAVSFFILHIVGIEWRTILLERIIFPGSIASFNFAAMIECKNRNIFDMSRILLSSPLNAFFCLYLIIINVICILILVTCIRKIINFSFFCILTKQKRRKKTYMLEH